MKQMQPGEVEPLECLDTDNIIGVRIVQKDLSIRCEEGSWILNN